VHLEDGKLVSEKAECKKMGNNEENAGMYLIHHCKGYIENVQHLSLSMETSQRAKRCGFNIADFADSCLKTIVHNVNGNSYDDMAKILDIFGDAAILFLKKYQIKDIEVGRFQSSNSQEESVIYLSENTRWLHIGDTWAIPFT
jgi:hypothetical protein